MSLERSKTEILIVDDDPGMRDLLSSNLRERGYSITTAGSAGEAVAQARAFPYAVIICDFKMPILDGINCLDLIKTFRPETEFIMMSGEGSIHAAVESVKKGAVDFLQKPIEMKTLLRLLEKSTARARLRSVFERATPNEKGSLMLNALDDLILCFEANAGGVWKVQADTLAFEGAVGYDQSGPAREMLDLVVQVAAAAKTLAPRNGSLNQIQRDRLSDTQWGALTTQIRSHLAVPLFFENRFFGVLGLSRLAAESAFLPQEVQAVRDMADRLAARVAYSEVCSELERKTNELREARENKKAA